MQYSKNTKCSFVKLSIQNIYYHKNAVKWFLKKYNKLNWNRFFMSYHHKANWNQTIHQNFKNGKTDHLYLSELLPSCSSGKMHCKNKDCRSFNELTIVRTIEDNNMSLHFHSFAAEMRATACGGVNGCPAGVFSTLLLPILCRVWFPSLYIRIHVHSFWPFWRYA